MISYVFGAPRAGKSYYAVSTSINESFRRYVITNIPLSKDVVNTKYIYLEYTDLISLFSNTQDILEKDISIDEKVKALQDVWLKGALIVIDEAHLFGFGDRKKEFLRDFLSIHAHLHIDIMVITQTPRAIRSDILDLGGEYIKVQPASKRLRSSVLEYIAYSTMEDYRRADPLMELWRKKVFADPAIFAMYKSGANDTGNNSLRLKILKYAAVVLIAVSVTGYNSYKLMSKPPVVTEIKNIKVPKKDKNVSHKINVAHVPDTNITKPVYVRNDSRRELTCHKIFKKEAPDWRKYNIVTKIKEHYYEVCKF